jgi:seryl-tRNA synthetase
MPRTWIAAALLLVPAALLTLYPPTVVSRPPADNAGEQEKRVAALQAACDKLDADNKALAALVSKLSKEAAKRLENLESQVKGLSADLAAEKAKVALLEAFKTTVERDYKPSIDRHEQKTKLFTLETDGAKREYLTLKMGPNRQIRFQGDGNLVITGGGKHWHSNTWE